MAHLTMCICTVLLVAVGAKFSSQYYERLVVTMADVINGLNSSWTAGSNPYFRGMSEHQIRRMMGVRLDRSTKTVMAKFAASVRARTRDSRQRSASRKLEAHFDARKRWPRCLTISTISDQGNCGSCYAVSAVDVMNDRLCIHSDAKLNTRISAMDPLLCCFSCGEVCNGGNPYNVWLYYKNIGIVTGGSYASGEGCLPYAVPPCDHGGVNGTYGSCEKHSLYSAICTKTCQANYSISYAEDKHFGLEQTVLTEDVQAIQTEISNNGPAQALLQVYEDFLLYKRGIYRHHVGELLGGHAVRIIGWGEEDCLPYWLVANSWNDEWGDHGLFKILRATNECDIERQILASLPKLTLL